MGGALKVRHRGPELPDDANATFAVLRPRLFGIAYRVLGSSTEAEDVVQETWLRWRACDHDAVRDPAAFLATTVTRLALNVAQSARLRRETYVGQWLPEPVDTRDDPALGAERSEALELAVLLLLEKLRPRERAVYVLSEAFEYPYAQIADMLDVTEANARQLASRARKLLARERRHAVGAEEHRRLFDAFLAAARAGDRAGLEQLLVWDAVSFSDGGGIAVAAPHPVSGRERVAKFVVGVLTKSWSGSVFDAVEANGRAATRVSRDGEVLGILTIGASADGIDRAFWVVNPHKIAGPLRATP
jgi:RNA polymerase sigma-70 factor (ECF subfamily)